MSRCDYFISLDDNSDQNTIADLPIVPLSFNDKTIIQVNERCVIILYIYMYYK